jgi:hypothetical protein
MKILSFKDFGSFLEKKSDEHFKRSSQVPGIDLNSNKMLF